MTENDQFLLRRLHSLTGVVPLGAFLFEHFFTNSFSHQGAVVYNEKVEFLRSLPFVTFLEWGFIFIPFIFHTLYGLVMIYRGQVNVQSYPYQRNWMYLLQRLSSFFALAFVLAHVLTLRFGVAYGGLAFAGGKPDFYDMMSRIFNDPLLVGFYVLGIISTNYHFANGLNTFCMTWGITIGRASQRLVGYACWLVGLGLTAMALWSMVGFHGQGTIEDLRRARQKAQAPVERVMVVSAAQGGSMRAKVDGTSGTHKTYRSHKSHSITSTRLKIGS